MMIATHAPALVDYIYMIDRYPEKGGHALVKGTSKSPGGAGANVMHNLAKLGVDAAIFTTLGEDEDAEFFIKNTFAKIFYEVTDKKTGKVHVFVDSSGERTFFVEPNAAAKPVVFVPKCDYLYIDPFPSEKSFEVQLKVLEESRSFKILNPGFLYVSYGFEKLKKMLKLVDMVILSKEEFKMLGVDKKDILDLVNYLIITEGSKGSMCFTKEGEFFAEAYKTKAIDTTGAGDAFAAGFLYAFMNSLPIEICLKLGNFCGAYKVARVGARNFPEKKVVDEVLATILNGRSE
ncbi:MAG: PfkB family carbohydrate kinase [Archaeoglobaceae archaeon]